jgi:hypothetical protein
VHGSQDTPPEYLDELLLAARITDPEKNIAEILQNTCKRIANFA